MTSIGMFIANTRSKSFWSTCELACTYVPCIVIDPVLFSWHFDWSVRINISTKYSLSFYLSIRSLSSCSLMRQTIDLRAIISLSRSKIACSYLTSCVTLRKACSLLSYLTRASFFHFVFSLSISWLVCSPAGSNSRNSLIYSIFCENSLMKCVCLSRIPTSSRIEKVRVFSSMSLMKRSPGLRPPDIELLAFASAWFVAIRLPLYLSLVWSLSSVFKLCSSFLLDPGRLSHFSLPCWLLLKD